MSFKNITIDEAVKIADYEKLLLKRRENDMLLSNFQVDVLKKNGINYLNYKSVNELLFDIESILFYDYDSELDLVSSQLAELIYYNDTKK